MFEEYAAFACFSNTGIKENVEAANGIINLLFQQATLQSVRVLLASSFFAN